MRVVKSVIHSLHRLECLKKQVIFVARLVSGLHVVDENVIVLDVDNGCFYPVCQFERGVVYLRLDALPLAVFDHAHVVLLPPVVVTGLQ